MLSREVLWISFRIFEFQIRVAAICGRGLGEFGAYGFREVESYDFALSVKSFEKK
jgi:hypothetical protein